MKRSLTKTRFMIMGLLLLLAGGYVTGAAYLNSSGFRQEMLLQANAAMDGRLTIDGHYLALHDARLELSGVRLADAQGELLAEIKGLQLRLNWAALFRRTIHIKTLDVQDARFYLDFDPADQLRMIRAKKTSSPPDRVDQNKTVWAWRIDDMRLNQGALSFKRPAKQFEGQLNIRNITARADSEKPTGSVHIATSLSQWRQTGTAYELPPLNLSAGVDASQTITLAMETPMSKLNARGRLDRKTDEPILDVDCDIDLNPAELHAWLPENTDIKDRIHAHVTAKGSLKDPTITLHAAMSNAMVTGIPIGQLEVDLGMHHRKITIQKLRSRSDWGRLDLTGHINLLSVLDAPLKFAAAQWENLSYQLKLKGKNLQPDHLKRVRFPPGGTFELESDITGNGLASNAAHAKADISIQVSGLSPRRGAPDISGRLNAEIQRQGAVIDLNRLYAAVGGNKLTSNARIDLDNGRIEQSKTQIQSARLEELGALLGIQFPSGTGDLNIRCQGPFQRPTAHIDLLAREMSLGHHPLGRFLAEARLDKQGVLNITHMVLENQGSLVEGRGRLTMFGAKGDVQTDPDVGLDVDFQQLAPSDFGLTASAGSHFTGRISLGGTLQHLSGQAVLEESVVHWDDFDGRLKGNARWDDGRLTLSDLQLYKAASVVHVKGSAEWPQTNDNRWSATPQVEAQLQGENIRVQDFFPDHVGILAVEGMVSGPTTDLDGRFELSGSDLNIGGQPFKSLNIKGRSSADKILWDTLEINIEKGQQLTSQGWYAFDRRFLLNMTAEDIGLRHVAALQKAYPVDGRMDLRLKATGTIDAPQMDADLTIREPRLDDQPWDDFHVKAQMQGRRLELAADLNFDLAAQYLIDSGDFNISADFNRTDVTPYLALWVGADWAGKLSGSLRAKGNRREPEKIQGRVDLSDTELNYQNQQIISTSRLKASLENGRLNLPSTRMELLNNGFVNLQATGQLTTDLRISSDGRLPLAALTPFVDALEEPRGEVTFQASAQGPMNEMRWQTKLDFNDTGFEIPGLDQQVESLNGHLEVSPERLIVEDVYGRMDGGRFTLNGQMTLAAWQPIGGQLIVNAHALPLQWPDTMDVVLSGDLTFLGAKETPALSGQLILLEGSYYKDIKLNLLSAVTQTKRAVPVSSTYSVPGQLGRTSLNVAVTHRYPLLVNNNLANLQIAPDLKISGTLARPILSGRAQVTEGEVIFRRKSFEVKRGVVDFINPYKIEPNLDIVAEADIRQWRVSLALSGPPDQLVFKLNSDPAESENDILSLILLGRTGSELAKGEGGGKQTTRQMLASLVATAWGEDVKKQTGVDILEVETGTGDDQESADRVQLTVGKRLSRRLTLKYEVESGKEELVQRAISEYRFLEHLLASGFQDSKGGYGGELVFRIEY